MLAMSVVLVWLSAPTLVVPIEGLDKHGPSRSKEKPPNATPNGNHNLKCAEEDTRE